MVAGGGEACVRQCRAAAAVCAACCYHDGGVAAAQQHAGVGDSEILHRRHRHRAGQGHFARNDRSSATCTGVAQGGVPIWGQVLLKLSLEPRPQSSDGAAARRAVAPVFESLCSTPDVELGTAARLATGSDS